MGVTFLNHVNLPNAALRSCATLVCSPAPPLRRQSETLLHAFALAIHDPENVLGLRIPLIRGLEERDVRHFQTLLIFTTPLPPGRSRPRWRHKTC